MIKVRVLVGLAGSPYMPGQELSLPADVARQLVAEELAELLEPTQQPRSKRARTTPAN